MSGSTNPGQPVSNIVNVQILLSAAPAQGENVDTMLIVGTSSVIDVTERMRNYTTLGAVATDFGTSAPEYLAATLWFGQAPQPQSLNIGRWAQSATTAQLLGAAVTPTNRIVATWTAITTGAFEAVVNGAPIAFSGMNFSSDTNLNGVASTIQAELLSGGAPASTTCTWNPINGNFIITLGGATGTGSTISFLNPPTAVGSATFSTQPTAADTLTIDGTAIEFVASGATGNEVNIGGSLPVTLASLLTFLNSSTDVNILKMNYFVVGDVLYIASKVSGTPGNAYTLAKSSTAIAVSGATLTGGSGVDISGMLAMNATSSGAYVSNGVAAESAVTAVIILDSMFSNQWYGLAVLPAANGFTGATDSDYVAVGAYVEGSNVKHYQGVTTQEAGALSALDTSNIAYQLQQLKYNKSAVQYSSTNPYAVVSYLARILTTNWQGNNTTITEMFKQEPGVVGENLSQTQAAALKGFNCNVFIDYNNKTTIIQYGTSASGQYTDTIIGADWFAIQIMTDVYNLLYTSPTKIPQTDAGMHIIYTVLDQDCAEAVNNGLFAPGTWQTTGFGAITFGTYLSKGYYIYQPLVATQSAADRQARKSVPFQIAAKLGGAVHEADISVTINQ